MSLGVIMIKKQDDLNAREGIGKVIRTDEVTSGPHKHHQTSWLFLDPCSEQGSVSVPKG